MHGSLVLKPPCGAAMHLNCKKAGLGIYWKAQDSINEFLMRIGEEVTS